MNQDKQFTDHLYIINLLMKLKVTKIIESDLIKVRIIEENKKQQYLFNI